MDEEPRYIGYTKVRKNNVITLIEPVAERFGIHEEGDVGFYESLNYPDYILIGPIQRISTIQRLPIKKKKEEGR